MDNTINKIQKRKERRDRYLLSLYYEYMDSDNMGLEITFNNTNKSTLKNFFYWYDKKYLVETPETRQSYRICYRLSSEGIDYVENYLLNEMKKDGGTKYN